MKWDDLPPVIKDKCRKLMELDYTDVVEFFVSDIPPNSNAVKPKNAKEFTISQILPARKTLNLLVSSSQLTTCVADQVVNEFLFKNYNVLLCLPGPKRSAKPVQYVALLSLNMKSVPLLFSSDNNDLIDSLRSKCKYSSCDISENNRMVTAYVGAREGTLYFLKDFLFFGFKKPLELLLLAELESVSFTLVTSRTFNLVVKLLDDTQREFEKIDHKYYEMILEYINANNLNDESLAEERRAKKRKVEEGNEDGAAEEEEEEEEDDDDEEDVDVDIEDEDEEDEEEDDD